MTVWPKFPKSKNEKGIRFSFSYFTDKNEKGIGFSFANLKTKNEKGIRYPFFVRKFENENGKKWYIHAPVACIGASVNFCESQKIVLEA